MKEYNAFMLSAAVMVACAAVTLFADAPRPIWPGAGVNIRFTTPQTGELNLLSKSGIRYTRSLISWEQAEPSPGKFDFSRFDSLLSELKRKGIRPVFCLTGSNPGYQVGAPTLPEARAAFARWAGEAANHFKGQEIIWELWNEPNTEQSWRPSPSPSEYSALAVEAAKAMRFLDSNCRIIVPACTGIDMQFLNSSLTEELLGLVDGVSIHPNRNGGPEGIVNDIQPIRDLITRRAPAGRKGLPILCTGWGYSTARGKNSEGRQAMYTTRMWLLNSALGIPVTIFDTWQDDGPDPDNPAHRLGLVRENLDLKPSFIALKEVQEKFGGCTNFRRLPQKDPLRWVIVGAGNGKLVQASWYQKDAGVNYVNLSMRQKSNKSLYTSLMADPPITRPKLITNPPPATNPSTASLEGMDFAFAPPIDEDGWCVLVQKSSAATAKLEFRYQRSTGANVTCYAKIEGSRIVEPLSTSEASPTIAVGTAGMVGIPFKLQQIAFDVSQWSSQKAELLKGKTGMLLNYEGSGRAIIAPRSPMSIPEGATALVVWVRPDGTNNRLKSEFRNTSGETVTLDLGSMEGPTDRNGWRVVKIALNKLGAEWISLLTVEAERGGSIEIGPAAYMF